MIEHVLHGEPIEGLSPESLRTTRAQHTLAGCNSHRDFRLIELRRRDTDGNAADIIVVDCHNDQVPSDNATGIKNRERLALVFPVDETKAPDVRALRKDFPVTLHQNHVPAGEPTSLCLYFEPWTAVERSWTPRHHLQRVLWWLAETAKGTLHRGDQPVERVYFDSPVEVVLPPEFDEQCHDNMWTLVLDRVGPKHENRMILSGSFITKAQAAKINWPSVTPLPISLPPMIHGRVERFPSTLGELEDQLSSRNVQLSEIIDRKIREILPTQGIPRDSDGRVALIFHATLKRDEDGAPEEIPPWGFLTSKDLTYLGEVAGILDGRTGRYCCFQVLGQKPRCSLEKWRDLPITPISVSTRISRASARKASCIGEQSASFSGILAGTGALGGVLAEIWSREAWGKWTLIDHDLVKAHNLSRHVAKNCHVGHYKVEAVKAIVEANYHPGYGNVHAIPCSAASLDNEKIRDAFKKAEFAVEATTTLEVPRDLSQRDDMPRLASVFVTPSGFDCVLLLEDAERCVRLQSLEAQYYRAILNSGWGARHLIGHHGHLCVGGGCRDFSNVIPFDVIQLHAGILAQQIRVARDQSAPRIRVWSWDRECGAVAAFTPPVAAVVSQACGAWKVVWDEHVRENLRKLREQNLPNETGGIILGYIDQKLKTIFVVDVLPAPPDSQGDRNGFVRGVSGLCQAIEVVAARTAHIVGYVGEWHSHPRHASVRPSSDDRKLIRYLAETLARDGQPALMIIVGDDEIHPSIQEA